MPTNSEVKSPGAAGSLGESSSDGASIRDFSLTSAKAANTCSGVAAKVRSIGMCACDGPFRHVFPFVHLDAVVENFTQAIELGARRCVDDPQSTSPTVISATRLSRHVRVRPTFVKRSVRWPRESERVERARERQ